MGPERAGLALVLGAAVAMTACKKSENYTSNTGINDTGAAAAANTGTAPGSLTDANIFFLLDNANMLDSTAGAVAATKGTNSEVREFGKQMMRDHHTLRKDGQGLAEKLKIIPEASANDNSKAQYDKTMATLNGATKGKDFDRAYIDNEVAAHEQVLQALVDGMAAAQSAELKNFIQKAAPKIQSHFDMAKPLQEKMK